MFKELDYTLSKEQEEARNQLGQRLLEQPEIQLFMEKYDVPEAVIIYNASQFKRWLNGKRAASKVTKQDLVEDLDKGKYIDLSYDKHTGIISEYITEIPMVSTVRKEQAPLDMFKIFPIPERLKDVRLSNIDMKVETAEFKRAFVNVLDFIENDDSGLMLYGDLGVGKSYLAACVAHEFAGQRKSVAFVHVPTLLNHLKRGFKESRNDDSIIPILSNVSLLVIDDLGAEPVTPWSRDEILLTIFNNRLENRKKTIVTTNYTPNMLVEMYKVDTRGVSDEIRARRLVDRILALTQPVELIGKNRRFPQ